MKCTTKNQFMRYLLFYQCTAYLIMKCVVQFRINVPFTVKCVKGHCIIYLSTLLDLDYRSSSSHTWKSRIQKTFNRYVWHRGVWTSVETKKLKRNQYTNQKMWKNFQWDNSLTQNSIKGYCKAFNNTCYQNRYHITSSDFIVKSGICDFICRMFDILKCLKMLRLFFSTTKLIKLLLIMCFFKARNSP